MRLPGACRDPARARADRRPMGSSGTPAAIERRRLAGQHEHRQVMVEALVWLAGTGYAGGTLPAATPLPATLPDDRSVLGFRPRELWGGVR